jgi:tRNA (mo5U34)-methyltransferase
VLEIGGQEDRRQQLRELDALDPQTLAVAQEILLSGFKEATGRQSMSGASRPAQILRYRSRSDDPSRDHAPMTVAQPGPPADLAERIARNHDWYHTIELAPGVITPGIVDVRPIVHQVPIPADLTGQRCLDIGTWDGFWAFEMERRGGEVHAVDVPDPFRWDWPARTRILESYDGGLENLETIKRNGNGFPIARDAIGSSVERHEMTVYEISPEALGGFDFVFVGSILLHLRDPVGALERIRSVARGQVVVNDSIEYVLTKLRPRTATARLDTADRVWWWQPNLAALHSMIEQAGFEILERGKPYFVPFGPRYEVPKRKPGEIIRRLGTAKGWEELVLYRRGIPHAAVCCRPLAS